MQNYDVVIKAHKKDYFKLPYVVESLSHLNPQFDNIYIVSEDGYIPKTTLSEKIIAIKDKEVTPFIDKSRFNYRYNWAWVNMVSLTQDFTKNDLYLDVQADNVFLNQVNLFTDDGKPRLFTTKANMANNEEHKPYFNFSKKMFGIKKITKGSSYIIEFMLYDKNKLSALYEKYGSKESMINEVYRNVSSESYPADQEIYGNLVEGKFANDYEIVGPIETYLAGKFSKTDNLEEFLEYTLSIKQQHPSAISCSFHTYWIPNE